MAERKQNAKQRAPKDRRLFTLEVTIMGGPMTAGFVKENPVISRTIQIRGDQTLNDLHGAIFEAFDREDAHLYEFQIGGERPMDPEAKRYGLPDTLYDSFEDIVNSEGDATRTAIGSLGLKNEEYFGYWFDFGDDWWHQIRVADIADDAGRGRYPKISERIGESPPQYIDWDDENTEDDW